MTDLLTIREVCELLKISTRQLQRIRHRLPAPVEGLTFHDSRHEAVSRLSTKLDVLALAKMIGHRDLRMLQRYYNETADVIAERLT